MAPKVVIGPEDRFIGRKEISSLVPYTVQHVPVLEHAGNFPGRFASGRTELPGWNGKCAIE